MEPFARLALASPGYEPGASLPTLEGRYEPLAGLAPASPGYKAGTSLSTLERPGSRGTN
jgi:hypothetical protein